MSAKISASNLAQAVQELNIAWSQTRYSWRDAKSLQFQKTYLDNLPDLVTKSGSVMSELDALLRKVRKDCE
ncbi:MAG: hypothetical protein KDK97_24180 [Verrucomicrobiales bacterium]|nr:hypothetical protein [Verrucomicrobiales bacterium]MCP5557166.1 hypothetical protein [Verrucomicrobiaceae bacterium]